MGTLLSNDFTDQAIFKPTASMKVWVSSAVELITDNISLISESTNISRQSWYNWTNQDGFLSWYKSEWQKQMISYSWKLDVIGLQKAQSDFKYWEAMQKRVGNLGKDAEYKDSQITVRFIEDKDQRMFNDNC